MNADRRDILHATASNENMLYTSFLKETGFYDGVQFIINRRLINGTPVDVDHYHGPVTPPCGIPLWILDGYLVGCIWSHPLIRERGATYVEFDPSVSIAYEYARSQDQLVVKFIYDKSWSHDSKFCQDILGHDDTFIGNSAVCMIINGDKHDYQKLIQTDVFKDKVPLAMINNKISYNGSFELINSSICAFECDMEDFKQKYDQSWLNPEVDQPLKLREYISQKRWGLAWMTLTSKYWRLPDLMESAEMLAASAEDRILRNQLALWIHIYKNHPAFKIDKN